MSRKVYQIILENIEKIQTQGGEGNFVIFELPSGDYIQFAAENGGSHLYAEASENNLTDLQRSQLEQLGWEKSTINYSKQWNTHQAYAGYEHIAEFIVTTLKSVYALQAYDTLIVNLTLE